MKEGRSAEVDSQISADSVNRMLCVNPDELCVVTFIPVQGPNIEKRRQNIMDALQSLVEYWIDQHIRLFYVDVGAYPEADKLLNVRNDQATVIAFNSIEDTYSTLPASFSP